MKRTFLIASVLILLPIFAWAGPFLVCDPYMTAVVQPTYFSVTMDGVAAVQSTPEVLADNSVRLHYDLTGISNGSHNMTVAACDIWGCSSTVPFGFAKTVPGAPANLKLSNQ